MFATRRAARSLLTTSLFLALIFLSAAAALAQDAEVPRRPQGPAAGPIIKLPRETHADGERAPGREAPPAHAAPHASPRKWEYCAIVGFVTKQQGFSLSTPHKPWAVIRYFSGGQEEVEGGDEETALANAFARLGEEGWEMTAVRTSIHLEDGDGRTRHVYYFKRPKPVE
ncbi:MAG TPA: hypothetical protein VEY09_02710 [Pyrinomonadaceae bacterium]|nr:hypothetical protein [Pyrinomonadaceae bacterium]